MKLVKFNSQSAAWIKIVAAVAALGVAGAASAQSAGKFAVKVGVGEIAPQVHSGEVSAPALPHTTADVGSDARPIFDIMYGITDNLSAVLALGLPFRHDIYGAGAIAGTGKVGSTKALPPTAFLQYHFGAPEALFRPYVGLGATYAYFRDETGSGQLTALTNTGGPATTFSIDNKLTATAQAGLSIRVTEKVFADFMISKTRLRTVVHYSTGQTQDMRLDPKTISMSIGYKF
ncbi:MAG: OmpW/AlkL family protein [Gammaproteobacteria bacterium]